MRAAAPDWQIDSAGTSDWHIGNPPYAPMISAAGARGFSLQQLRARQFSAADFARFDLIIAMDANNRADIEALRPAGNTTPVELFTRYGPGKGDVPDPYFTDDYEGCLDLIETCAKGLADI